MPIPILKYHRPPQGAETQFFTSSEANKWNENYVAFDLDAGTAAANKFLEAFAWVSTVR